MASDVEGADRWADLRKYLETSEPTDISEIRRLLYEGERLPRSDASVDLSRDLPHFSHRHVALDSEEFKGWWSKAQVSPLLINSILTPLDPEGWLYLMNILTVADVSHIEHLVLQLDDIPRLSNQLSNQLGIALSRRAFSNLKTLIISPTFRFSSFVVGIGAIADAIRGPGLVNLRTLAVPNTLDVTVLRALAESCVLSQLTSLHLTIVRDVRSASSLLDTIFQLGRLKSLQLLEIDGYNDDSIWKILANAIKCQNLPRLVSLYLYNHYLKNVDLADFFRESREWLASLEKLQLRYCSITSRHVCSLVDAVMEVPTTRLALKSLNFNANRLGGRAVLALVRLVDSQRLPQLQLLDLSDNHGNGMSKSLVPLLQSIGRGGLPSLPKLIWESGSSGEIDTKGVVQAYYAYQTLTTDLTLVGGPYSLETKLKIARDRNLRLASRLAALREELGEDIGDFVPYTSAKAFLCGYPEVGKTTLRRALVHHFGIKTRFMRETRPVKEKRTRGIEISRIEKKIDGTNVTLLLWDLAGQEEYHVLHGAFLTDLGFEGGKATTFIVVFKASFGDDVEEKLGYWLRFVASSSLRLVKRHVVVILNCFDGVFCTEADLRLWKALIGSFAAMFNDILDIRKDPFIIDVRKAAPVQPLKDHLVNHAHALLQGVGVPRICLELHDELKRWSGGEGCSQLPILTWGTLEQIWRSKSKRNDFSVAALKYAAAYLHEIGEIIYFEKKLSKSGSASKTILVSDPDWFCRKVVGDLLLPTEMREGGSSIKVGADGSISLVMFSAFFQDLLVGDVQREDVISMLELVGLCYRKGEQDIIVPALIREDNYSSINWGGNAFHGVMGRCLVASDTEKNLIPVSLFRRLQVHLAQDLDFGGRQDSDFKVGKSFVNFNYGELLVLIQFDVDRFDPTDDRIDVLVKSAMRGDPAEVTSAQVQCICDIMQKVEEFCAVCCDGLAYEIKVIQPCSAANWSHNMSERKLMSLKQIQDLLVKGKEYLAWQVDGQNVKTASFLAKVELGRLVGTAKQEYDACRQDAIAMGLLPKDSFHEKDVLEERSGDNAAMGNVQSMSMRSDRSDHEPLTMKIFSEIIHGLEQRLGAVVHEEARHIRQHVDRRSTELLLEFRRRHELLVKHIQEQQSFSMEEKGSSVPRYMFLSKVSSRLTKDTYQMHFFCESHFDDGLLHEVKDQEGLEMPKTKEWFIKVSPWLRRSLQVAVLVVNAVGNMYMPGLFSIIANISEPSRSEGSAKAVDRAVALLLEEHEGIGEAQGVVKSVGISEEGIDLNERKIAQGVVTDQIDRVGRGEFARKTGLRRVVLRAPDVGTSKQAEAFVLWICDDCFEKYGNRATPMGW